MVKKAWIFGIGWIWVGVGFAADPVTDAMTSAYAPYRVVLFRTNSKAQLESESAMAQAQEQWKQLVSTYAKAPPPPYDRDAQFAQTLAEVGAVYEIASNEIRDKQLTKAHETLEKARDLMADIRRRNQVIVYSDHMNAYHAEMERLLDDGPKWAGHPQDFLPLMARLGVLEFLAARLRSEAPGAVVSDPGFVPALTAVEQSLSALRQAIMAQDSEKVRDLLPKIKAPYSRLFLKFG